MLYIQHVNLVVVCIDFLVVSGFWVGDDRVTGGSKFSWSSLVTGGQVGSDPQRIKLKPRNKKEYQSFVEVKWC